MVVGIDNIGLYTGTLALPLDRLALARGRPAEYPATQLLTIERTVLPPWEDPVTMAVAAAQAALRPGDREAIELIIVATESAVDHGKAMATYVHELCGIQPRCRCLEVKQACYGGGGALMLAAHWLRSLGRPGARALLVCTDQSRFHPGRPWEYITGAGAAAMVLSAEPELFSVDLDTRGYWSTNVHDTFRPSATEEVGNAEDSVLCYLDALEGALDNLLTEVDPAALASLAGIVYHTPFGAMTRLAHRTLLRRAGMAASARASRVDFERRVRPGLRLNARMGGSYTAAIFIALAGTIAALAPSPGAELGVFAYGSGSTGEFFRGRVGQSAALRVADLDLDRLLDRRRRLTVPEYEAIELGRAQSVERRGWRPDRSAIPGHFESAYLGRGRLVLDHVDGGWVRHYVRS